MHGPASRHESLKRAGMAARQPYAISGAFGNSNSSVGWTAIMPNLGLRIRGRLYAGFSALVMVGLTMAIVAVWNLWTVQSQVERLSTLSDNTARVQEISVNLQALRRANLHYIYDANAPAFKEAAEREAATEELLRTMAKAAVSEERRKIYSNLIGDIEKIRTLRERMGRAVRETTAGKAALLPGGDELTANTGKLVVAARANDGDVAASVA